MAEGVAVATGVTSTVSAVGIGVATVAAEISTMDGLAAKAGTAAKTVRAARMELARRCRRMNKRLQPYYGRANKRRK